MNINDILKKEVLEIDEMIFLVKKYIKEVKDKDIEASVTNLPVNHPFFPLYHQQEVKKLHEAYNYAYAYFKQKQQND